MEERVNSHLLRLIAQRATRASPGKKVERTSSFSLTLSFLFFFWHGLKVYVTLTPKREGTHWPD
jgi:hypothetical protein